MDSNPEQLARHVRRLDIDWARGVAVLIMILAHVLDAWVLRSERTTTAFQYFNVLSGFAAPLFLWLSGFSLVLAGERAVEHHGDRRRAWTALAGRGLEVFILAFAFRLQSFLFNPGGFAIAIFRVDILNIMGPALVLAAVAWGMTPWRAAQVVVLAGMAMIVAMLTPMVEAATWVDRLPVWCQWYVRPAGDYTVFTLLPWAGFVFAGGAVGAVVASTRSARAQVRVPWALTAAGVAILAFGLFTSTVPSIYLRSSFWTNSPTFFAVRVGVLLLTGGVLHAAALVAVRHHIECRPLRTLGRASLFVYWIHVQIVYGWATWPLHHRLQVWQALVASGLVAAVMYALIPLRDRLAGWWQSRRFVDEVAASV